MTDTGETLKRLREDAIQAGRDYATELYGNPPHPSQQVKWDREVRIATEAADALIAAARAEAIRDAAERIAQLLDPKNWEDADDWIVQHGKQVAEWLRTDPDVLAALEEKP